jgi:hypothetical protein
MWLVPFHWQAGRQAGSSTALFVFCRHVACFRAERNQHRQTACFEGHTSLACSLALSQVCVSVADDDAVQCCAVQCSAVQWCRSDLPTVQWNRIGAAAEVSAGSLAHVIAEHEPDCLAISCWLFRLSGRTPWNSCCCCCCCCRRCRVGSSRTDFRTITNA